MVRGSSGKTPKSSVYRGVTLFRPTGKWRAQISAYGKTTSLGDHDTEEEAARAFDKAVINKDCWAAKTNFPIDEYADQVNYIHALPHADLVALLRDAARKSNSTSSNYKGVTLLRPTGKWNAQINLSGKQVHLGLHATEEDAARAYDRAAVFKALQEGTSADTNFDVNDYEAEFSHLSNLTEEELIAEAISSCASPKQSDEDPKRSSKRTNSSARRSSRPQSPSTPECSEEVGARTNIFRHRPVQRSCYSVTSHAINKRMYNRRCRQIPVRACLA